MGSADFRIIPHQVATSADGTKPDLWRYLISYTTSNPPQFIAAGPDGRFILVSDDKSALRFPSMEDAEQGLARARDTVFLDGQEGLATGT